MGHVFISYSSQDTDLVNRLLRLLNDAGFEVWIDREGIAGGAMWRKQIVEAIDGADVVLLVLSPHSVNSDNVRKELDIAEEAKKSLLPVEIQRVTVPKAMAYQLAGVQRIDLVTNFDSGAKRLVEALRRLANDGARAGRTSDSGTIVDTNTTSAAAGPAQLQPESTIASPQSAGSHVEVEPSQGARSYAGPQQITLLKEFATVWYRSGDKRTTLVAYSASGKLVISEHRVVFGEKDEAIDIGIDQIKSVSRGKMRGDLFNNWAILRYGDPEKIAGFKDGSQLGWGGDTNLIYSALESALGKRSGQPTR